MNNNSDNDPAWKLLDKASTQQADEMFSRNVMRSIRQQEQESWWKTLLQPTPVFATLATAAACIALVITTQTNTVDSSQHSIATTPEESFEQLAAEYQAHDDFDDLISPIALVATNDSDMLNNLDIFMNF